MSRGRVALLAVAVVVGIAVVLGVLAVVLTGDDEPVAAPSPTPRDDVRHVVPDGTGDGSLPDRGAALADLPALVAQVGPGGQVVVHGDRGAYDLDEPIVVDAGGAPGEPVVIRGVPGRPRPRLVGDRVDPYEPGGDSGKEVFRLVAGADHLRFVGLHFANVGDGAVRVGAPLADLGIHDVTARNVRRFLESNPSDPATDATLTGLRMSRVLVEGFSKGVVRLVGDTSDVVISDVWGDSQRQDKDRFAMGVAIQGTTHGVTLERVTMRNAQDTRPDDKYWNGDGFTAEEATYDLRFVDTVATGNTDAGYDVKANDVEFVRAMAGDNKRNYRLHGSGVVIRDSVGLGTNDRGGSGGPMQIHARDSTQVQVTGSRFEVGSPAEVVFFAEPGGDIAVADSRVELLPDTMLSREIQSGTVALRGITERVLTGADAPAAPTESASSAPPGGAGQSPDGGGDTGRTGDAGAG